MPVQAAAPAGAVAAHQLPEHLKSSPLPSPPHFHRQECFEPLQQFSSTPLGAEWDLPPDCPHQAQHTPQHVAHSTYPSPRKHPPKLLGQPWAGTDPAEGLDPPAPAQPNSRSPLGPGPLWWCSPGENSPTGVPQEAVARPLASTHNVWVSSTQESPCCQVHCI